MKNELKVIITRGLPASGKSTYALQWVKEDPDNRVMIEKDAIRKDGRLFKDGVYVHKRGDEGIVIKERDRLIHKALQAGKSVVSSDTNLVQKHVAQISAIARKYSAKVEIVSFLDVPLKDLIERDLERKDSVGEQVIRRMFHEQVKTLPTFLKYDPSLPFCVISDVDSTLTLGPKNRSPYEWAKVGNDDINIATAHILDAIKVINYVDKIFIFSGRDSVCRKETEAWLEKNDIEYDGLFMRQEGDNRSDAIIKAELLEKYVVGKYNVLFVMDDRKRVCDLWRDVYGLTVFQLGDTNYSF